jgi:hypothetical protein
VKKAEGFAVLIPSRGRWTELAKTFEKQPFLNTSDTYVGIEHREWMKYKSFLKGVASKVSIVRFDNPNNQITVAREHIRREAVRNFYDDYIITDDNTRYSEQSLHNLVLARRRYPQQPCIMAGMHGTAAHFHKKDIEGATTHGRYTSYPKMSSMFWCFPHELYSKYQHPMDYSFDDHHLAFWLIEQGVTNFRVCVDAPFSKSRHRPGGNGSLQRRTWIIGKRIQRLCEDFPSWISPEIISYRINWSKIEDVIARQREWLSSVNSKAERNDGTPTMTIRIRPQKKSSN